MSKYKVVFTRQAEKSLDLIAKTQPKLLKRLVTAIDELEIDPTIGKVLKGGLAGLFSYRVGDYRVVYQVLNHKLIVTIIDIGHRKNIYK